MIKKQEQTMKKMISLTIGLLVATLFLLFTLGGDQLESAFSWDKDMKSVQNSVRCDAQAVASGARGTELKAVKDACIARMK